MKYLHRLVQKSAIFVILLLSCFMLNFSAFAAYSDSECFGGNDGTPAPTGVLSLVTTEIPISETYLAEALPTVIQGTNTFDANVLYRAIGGNTYNTKINPNGIIDCTSTSACNLTEMKSSPTSRKALNTQLDYYLAGQHWSVTFPGKGTVSGYAYCGPNGWGSGSDKSVKNGAPGTAYAGCGCTISDLYNDNISSFRFITHKQVFSGNDWIEKSNNCRQNCPSICANRVATDSSFRQKLFQECPVFETSGSGGGDDPVEVHCNAGYYLPGGATSCSACTGNYYCTEDTYNTSSQDQGLKTCPSGQEPNGTHTGCVTSKIQCSAGYYLPANSNTCTACESGYYCEAGSYDPSNEDQGLKTCDSGYEPNASQTGCEEIPQVDQCFGAGDGTPLTTTAISGLPTVSEMEANGTITISGSTWAPANMSEYIAGQKWSVQFETGTVIGYAGCTATGWSTTKSYSALSSVNSGCACSLDGNTWRFARAFSDSDAGSSNRTIKSEYCRANCPAECAQRFATNQDDLRTYMHSDYGACPVGEAPTQIHCNAGYYLPGGAISCTACTGDYYCPGGDYTPSSQIQGRQTCDFGYEPNGAHTSCTPKMVECADGYYLPHNSLTCTACTDNYYCTEDIYEFSASADQGLKTCSAGQEPNETHTACVTNQIQCSAGYYLPANSNTCSACESGYYCEAGSYDPSNETQGLKTCDFGYEPNSSQTACEPTLVECNAGYYLPANSLTCDECTDNFYCEYDVYEFNPSEPQGRKTCATGYEPNYNHTSCELSVIHCNDGYYLPKNSLSCAACIGFQYATAGNYNFSTTEDQGKNVCGAGYMPNENHSACVATKFTCPAGKYLPDYSSSEYDCQWCPDPYEVGDYYYCPGGEYDANSPTNAGMFLCPEHSYSEEEAEYCTCNDGYTTDGKPANSSNKHTTTTACVVEGSVTYSATYVCEAGGESVGSVNVNYGSTFTLTDNSDWNNEPLCEKYGYDFGGWKDNLNNEYSAGDTFTWNYDDNLTFTAIWNQRPVYAVSYSCGDDATGGYAPSGANVIYGTDYTTLANTCEKTGNNFLGWVYNDNDLYEAGETFTYNYNTPITLVPLWEAVSIHCEAGYWVQTNETVCNIPCLEGYYCPGGDFTYDGANHGLEKCDTSVPAWAKTYVYSESGATSASNCRISVAMGMYGDENGLQPCEESFYCPGFSGSVAEFNTSLNNTGMVGIEDCSEAQHYKAWGWTSGVTSDPNSTAVQDCKIVIAPTKYMDDGGAIRNCSADHYCPGITYLYDEADDFFTALVENGGAGIYNCPANSTSDSGATECHCSGGYMLDTTNNVCIAQCGAGYYLPNNASSCIEVGAGYYSPSGDSSRYACPTNLTTSGSGIGADESSDCGRVLHIGGETLRMRNTRKTTPSLNVKIEGNTYYGDMSVLPTNINASSSRKLHVKYGNVEQYVHDTTIE